jgi:hypothetical protein
MTRTGRTRGLRDRRRARPRLTRAVRLESGTEGGVEARP